LFLYKGGSCSHPIREENKKSEFFFNFLIIPNAEEGGKKMNIVVQKYGGSSVATAEKMLKVAEYVKQCLNEENVVVVVSARGKTTDELNDLAKEAFGGEIPQERDLRDELNKLLVTGEEQSAPLLALVLQRVGVPAVSLTSREIELEANSAGKVKMVRGVQEIVSLLEKGIVPVVTGFQGIVGGTKKVILGHGGSDVTAVVLTAALGSRICENYTDVDGVFTADPRLIPKAKRFEKISYSQLIELASLGGGKLLDRAVILAQNLGVEIRVMLSPSFGKSCGGTLVCSGSSLEMMESNLDSQPGIVIQKLALIRLSDIPNKPGVAEKIFGSLSNVNLVDIVQAPAGEKAEITILCLSKDVAAVIAKLVAENTSVLPGVKTSGPFSVATVTLVDPAMKEEPGYLSRMCRAIATANTNIEALYSSGVTITTVVNEEAIEKTANALAKEFHLLSE
jgi:aspartate kinase